MHYFGVDGSDEAVELEDEVYVLPKKGLRGREFIADSVLVESTAGAYDPEDADFE